MTTLTDTQRLILAAALARPDRCLLPLPDTLKGGAAAKVVAALLAKGLAEEVTPAAGAPVWRTGGDGRALTLVATAAAAEALGGAPDAAAEAQVATDAPDGPAPDEVPSTPPTGPRREGTKQALLLDMLRLSTGATAAEIAALTGWQPHTVRGAISGVVRKRLGLEVTSEAVEGRGRVYRLG